MINEFYNKFFNHATFQPSKRFSFAPIIKFGNFERNLFNVLSNAKTVISNNGFGSLLKINVFLQYDKFLFQKNETHRPTAQFSHTKLA